MDQKIKLAQVINQTSRDLGSIPDWNIMLQGPNLPRGDLLDGSRERYLRIGLPLFEASITGDWKVAKTILDQHPELVRFAITENYDTALHIAATRKDTTRPSLQQKLMEYFVQNLVSLMDKKDLEHQNKNHHTAFFVAAAAGSVKLAQIMVKKNSALPEIPGTRGEMPLYAAAVFGKHDMVKYLYDVSQKMNGNHWTDHNRGEVVLSCVETDIFDVPQLIMTDHPELTANLEMLRDVLQALAQKPDAFSRREGNVIWRIVGSIFPIIRQKLGPAEKDGDALKLLTFIWDKINIMPTNVIDKLLTGPTSFLGYHSRILFVAAEKGNTTFIVELIRGYPELMWKKNSDGLTIFHIAVMHRHEGIFNLLYEIGSLKDLITPLKDINKNNMLHLVGMTSKQMRPHMSGAPQLMQRELMWYKGVDKMMPPGYREMKNNAGEKPYELFSKNNEDRVSQGLKWMKDCMVVATLIVTIAFAIVFTVPGGYNQNNGIPMFVHDCAFLVFIIADAISLVCSSASILVFLSILTSRISERDFMGSLPTKLMIGLVTLFISLTAMMITFSVSFFILYHNGWKWVPILISVFGTGPIILFAILQVPMLADMIRSMIRSMHDDRYIFKPKKRMFDNVNPGFCNI